MMGVIQMNNEESLIQIAASDGIAFNQLHTRYSNRLFRRACHVLGDETMAEDVVQDVFLQVWRKAGTFNPGQGTLINWLNFVVRNRAIDVLRHQRVQQEENWADLEVQVEDLVDNEMRVEQSIIKNEMRLFLVRMLHQLPSEQRMVIQLSYFQGFSQAEIARMLHEPLGTIKTRMRSGLKKLRKYKHQFWSYYC
jgi:RNA polymerase sigma-70 factor (ECF subfamily)